MTLIIFLVLAQITGVWTGEPPMQHARSAHNVVATESAIYAIAGSGEGNAPVVDVEAFDGKRWRIITKLPSGGLNAPGSVAVGDKIYVFGGFSRLTNMPTEGVLIFDIKNGTWSEGAKLPSRRGGFGIAVLNGKIHLLGGGNSERTLADHSVYDPKTKTWSEAAPLKRSKGSPAIVAYKGELWAIGGRSGPTDFGDVDIYDPASNSWRAGPAISPRGTIGAVVYHGAILVFGGELQAAQSVTNEVLRLNPQTLAWEALEPMPTARNYARAVVFKDAVYVVGGNPSAGASHSAAGSNIVERFRE
jgi:N-acetylneuraminic acid mutarotase